MTYLSYLHTEHIYCFTGSCALNTYDTHLPWLSEQVSTSLHLFAKRWFGTWDGLTGGHFFIHFCPLELKESLKQPFDLREPKSKAR